MRKHLLTTAALVLAGTALVTVPASAGPIDWNFQDHLGLLGTSQGFTAGGLTLTARGFDGSPLENGVRLFSKNGGTDEIGLGLNNDPSTNDEISFGHGFVQLNLDGIRNLLNPGGFTFNMASTTQGEGWQVWGSNDATILDPLAPFQFTLLASSTDPGGQEGFHTLAGGYDNYNFFYNGLGPDLCGAGCNANVLLANFDAVLAVPAPIVGAGLPGLIAACCGLLGLGWKRRQRAA